MTQRLRPVAEGAARLGGDACCRAAALQNTLPTPPQGLLLAACLCEQEVAVPAWRAFIDAVGDVKRYFESDRSGLKGLLPFVESRLAANGINSGKVFHTYARVASVREGLRSQIYLEILAKTLDALASAGIEVILLKGGALSATVYPQPSWRHNHAIDLLIDSSAMVCANGVLQAQQFVRQPVRCGAADHNLFQHSTGLALGLHARPFYLPHFDMPLDEVGSRAGAISLGETRARVMSREDCLVHVCGHSVYSRSRSTLRWACDAYYLVQNSPALDWDQVVETAAYGRLVVPVLVSLRWLKETLHARIPAAALSELEDRARNLDAVAVEGIYAALLHSSPSLRMSFGWANTNFRSALAFGKFCIAPSLRYMRWKYNVGIWTLPYYYVLRPLKFIARSIRGEVLRLRNPQAVAHVMRVRSVE
jgi:hypothetical protein